MFKTLHLYFALVAAGAIALCLSLDWSVLGSFSGSDWLGVGTFAALTVLSQRLEVDSTLGAATPVKVSIAFLPLLALAVVMPPAAVVIVCGGVQLLNEVLFRERALGRTVFNVSQIIICYGVGALVYHALGRALAAPGNLIGVDGISSTFLPFIGLAATFSLLNVVLVSIVLALRQSERLLAVMSEALGRGGGNFLYDLLASPVALVAAFLYSNLFVGGLLVVVLPLLLIRHSYLSAIQLQQANRDLLKVLVKTIETRDPYTSGHSLRVSQLARMVAVDYGLRPALITQVETAALLHDIGKIDVQYASVIAKPSDLSEAERRLIQSHATRGADLLQSLTSLEKAIIVGVRHHHERYDGSGYPDGLRGKSIPLAGRIIMICDSVDAMLSDRPYRQALSVEDAQQELTRCAGTQFDPDLVQTIIQGRTLERAELLVDRSGARRLDPALASSVVDSAPSWRSA